MLLSSREGIWTTDLIDLTHLRTGITEGLHAGV